MKIIVFCGPTLPANVAGELLPDADVRPPAACGDVYRATEEGPAAIALVDGYFDHRLSVWHKEVTWALHQGVHVYGAGSMGALRAAELEPFGMVGVGWVFEQFRSRALEDDDEVAVVHEPAERAYRARSDAMVNLRATLSVAVRLGVLEESSRDLLIQGLKAQFYPRRNQGVLRDLASRLLPLRDGERFTHWLEKNGVVDQKRLDACALLTRLGEDAAGGRLDSPFRGGRIFQHTNAWQALVESVAREGPASRGTVASGALKPTPALPVPPPLTGSERDLSALLAALKARFPERYLALVGEALERALAVSLADARGAPVDGRLAQRASEEFRRQRGLFGPEETAVWLSRMGLDLVGFSSLINDGVQSKQLEPAARRALLKQLRDVVCIHDLAAELR
jgi:hypothetical protein